MDNNINTLDTIFHALADPTRRAVIQKLGQGPATVIELAEPFDMALPSAYSKHPD
jgi:DNA-binding transcriptional ArsR family regulator